MSVTVDLRLGDCLEILPTLTGVDAVITDPPYGIDYVSNKDGKYKGVKIDGDKNFSVTESVLKHYAGLPMAVFASPTTTPPRWLEVSHVLVWDKRPLPGMGDLDSPWRRDVEFIWICGKRGWRQRNGRHSSILRGETIVTWSSLPHGRVHPTQKPVSVIEIILDRLDATTVLDPFMGSGTTGVACMKLGRSFTGCEIDPHYFAIAQRRIEQAQGQLTLPLPEW